MRRNVMRDGNAKGYIDLGFFADRTVGVTCEELAEGLLGVANDRDDGVAVVDIEGGCVCIHFHCFLI